jgi:hypothetical protein
MVYKSYRINIKLDANTNLSSKDMDKFCKKINTFLNCEKIYSNINVDWDKVYYAKNGVMEYVVNGKNSKECKDRLKGVFPNINFTLKDNINDNSNKSKETNKK